MKRYVLPYADVLAWCLMPNHFHFLVQVKRGRSMSPYGLNKGIQVMLRSYTRGINMQEGRTGSLFTQKTKGKVLDSLGYALACFHYIHRNPLSSGLEAQMGEWPHTSLQDYLEDDTSSDISNPRLARSLLDLPNEKARLMEYPYALIPPEDLYEIF